MARVGGERSRDVDENDRNLIAGQLVHAVAKDAGLDPNRTRLHQSPALDRNRTAAFSSKKAITLASLVKIPGLHFQRIDMKVGNKNIPRLDRRRSIPRIRTSRRSMGELVTATCRQFELPITISQGG